jgi:hypothetical protein
MLRWRIVPSQPKIDSGDERMKRNTEHSFRKERENREVRRAKGGMSRQLDKKPSMIENSLKIRTMSRFSLLLAAAGWGISFIFTFSSWPQGVKILSHMGASSIKYQGVLDYWLKMASAVFGCLGIMYFICFMYPDENRKTIRYLSGLSIFVGTVLVFAAINNNLSYPSQPTFPIDIGFCYFTGFGGLLYKSREPGKN